MTLSLRAHLATSENLKPILLVGVILYCYVGVCIQAVGQDRRDRIDDRHSTRVLDRQRPGNRGRHHHPDDPVLQRTRTYDGSYNNQLNPFWGVAGVNLVRRVPSAYEDGISSMARSDQASPREISNLIFAQNESVPNSRNLTDMVWQWGQFLDHDIDLTETHLPLEPAFIDVPEGDTWFDPFFTGEQSIGFFRSLYNPNTGIDTPREQINEITAWIDGSNVYGSDEETANSLRLFRNGMMRVSAHPTGHLLPVGDDGFFLAGDIRANEQVYLTSMHTLFMREHNRVCRQLMANNPDLTDEQLFQAARRSVIATLQSITYNEFLPAILGENALRPYRGYNDRVNPNIANIFSTGAFRFGHSMLNSELLMMDQNGRAVGDGTLNLADAFFDPTHIMTHGIEPFLIGLCNQHAQEIDGQVVDDVRNFLFGPPGAGGFDLVSLNIQRGRDHGLPSIGVLRARYRLPPFNDFADITSDPVVQLQLQAAYPDVHSVDPWVAMLCEDHVPGASVGMTAYHVIRDQFERIRDGDRFWYERIYSGQTLERLQGIRLSTVIRRNTSITRVPRDVFRMDLGD